MSKSYSNQFTFILTIFVCLILMLCYFNRLATDDYYFIWDVRNHGIITGVTSQYMEWCGRFAATFAMDVFYKAFDINYAYYNISPILSAIFIFAGTYFLLGNCATKFALSLTKNQKRLSAASFTALLFFLSVDIGESWFWFCAQSSYLWSIIAFTWCCVFLTGRRNVLSTLLAIVCIIYVGGSSEIYAVFYGLLFTVILFRCYKRSETFKAFISSKKQLLIVYLFFALSFLIFLVAPGNYLRDGLFPEHQFLYSFFITAKSIVKFSILYLPFKLPYILIFTVPFLLLGNACCSIEIKSFQASFRTFFIRITSVFIIVLLLFFFLVAYVMVETGPPRIWLFSSHLFAVYCCVLFFHAGYKGVLNVKQTNILKMTSVVLGICLMLFHLMWQYPIASAYAKAADERVAYITDLNKTIQNDTLILLEPLPPPGMLYSTEIAADTNHFTNRELRLGYDLKFHVALRR